MHSSWHILKTLFLIPMLSASFAFGQNLVRNCELEQNNGCPTYHGQISRCRFWVSPGEGTTDYLHVCNNGNYSVPINQWGNQEARSGVAYAHIISYYPSQGNFSEYLQTELACELQEGKSYVVSFYVSCADDSYYSIDGMGAQFSVNPLIQTLDNIIEITGDVHVANPLGHVIDDKEGWTKIHGTYVAQGGEKYITIGNFLHAVDLTIETFSSWQTSIASYYVDDVSVIAVEAIINLGPDTTICSYDSITLDISNICDLIELHWENDSIEPIRRVGPGTYSIQGESGCTEIYDQITISATPDPGHFLPGDTIICPDQIIDLLPSGTYDTYEWQDGSNQPYYQTDTEGTFWLRVTDSYGCSFTDSIYVNSLTAPVFSLGNDTLFCLGLEITLDPGIDSLHNNYLWNDYGNRSTLTVSDSGEYWLRVSNPCGVMSDTILISTYNCNAAIAAPNAFTPNADGKNDIFELKGENISSFSMYVYDRWGSLIFESNDLYQGWNGEFKGKPCPVGVYVWIASYESMAVDVPEERKTIKGSVVLIR